MALYRVEKPDFQMSEYPEGVQKNQIIELADAKQLVYRGSVVPVDSKGNDILPEVYLSFGLPESEPIKGKTGRPKKPRKLSARYYYMAHQELSQPSERVDSYFKRLTEKTIFDLASASLLKVGYLLRDEEVVRREVLTNQGQLLLSEFIQAINDAIDSKAREIDERSRSMFGKVSQAHKIKQRDGYMQDIRMMKRLW